ncbi:hypothetical protein F66182_827 [Fusarium sp. NRRL 66182]|nr:hypothetical protein F66182_827 [Fusarium sp. NRRL 66182]
MKFGLFSFAFLTASAVALPQALSKRGSPVPSQLPANVPAVDSHAEVVDVYTSKKTVSKTITKINAVEVTKSAGVVKVFSIAVSQVKVQTSAISHVVKSFKAGTITKAVAITKIHQHFGILNKLLTAVVCQLTDVISVKISAVDVKTILSLVIELVQVVVACAKEVTGVLGLDNVLCSVQDILFQTLATLLKLVTGLIGDIVPGLVDTLSSILGTLKNSPLGPVVKPVSGVVVTLTGYLGQGNA